MDNLEKAIKLEEIQTKISDLVYEAQNLLNDTGIAKQRADRYWIGQILSALSEEEGYVGGSMFSMQDTINELKNETEDE